jgi:type II secretory pathway component GspD/PulD (secretin)
MDAPIIGGLFRNQADVFSNSEIVIFITPHIVSGEQPITDQGSSIKEIPSEQAAHTAGGQ